MAKLQPEATARDISRDNDDMAGLIHDLGNYIQIAGSAMSIIACRPDIAGLDGLNAMVAHAVDALERAGALVRRSFGDGDSIGDEDINIEDCLTQLVPLLRYACGPRISIRLDIGTAPQVRCSRLMLQNALLNLALNARDAMPEGGVLSISARAVDAPETSELEILVSDTGSGMSPSTLARAFEPHFTTKASNGHGLGLSEVKSSIEGLGGRILIESVQNVGTTVILRLPIRACIVPLINSPNDMRP